MASIGSDRSRGGAALLAGLVRLGAVVGLALTVAAIGLGRLYPAGSDLRRLRDDRPILVSGHFFKDHRPRAFEVETGQPMPIDLPGRRAPEWMSFSPWDDGPSGMQVVGQLGGSLVRFSAKNGSVLDRVSWPGNLSCPPCWFPGTAARVLAASWNGNLYECSFEHNDGLPSAPRINQVEWRTGRPASAVITDLTWPADARLHGCLLASIRVPKGDTSAFRLWWLRLDDAGRSVVASGPLLTGDLSDPDVEPQGFDERFPAWGTAADGSPVLAYLTSIQVNGELHWQLRVTRVSVDSASGRPRADRETSRALADDSLPSPLYVLPHAQTIAYLSRQGDGLHYLALRGAVPAAPTLAMDHPTKEQPTPEPRPARARRRSPRPHHGS